MGWWQDLQRFYSNGAWQFYVSSDFREQFPNATFNIVTEGNLVLNGTSSGHWSPTQGRTSAIYGGITTTLEGKFTYHCPGEIEMSTYYIPTINLYSGFLDPNLNTNELDQSLSLSGLIFSAGKGISLSQIKSNIKSLQKSGKGSLPYFNKGGRLLGFVSVGSDTKDFAINPTWGNAVIISFDLGSMTPYGWIYGIVDMGFVVGSGASLTDRIGAGIDSFLNKNGGAMIPLGSGYVWISNYKRK